jgi:hypothetical protein
VVKGLRSMWRQAAPIVRSVLHGVLVRILLHDDVRRETCLHLDQSTLPRPCC